MALFSELFSFPTISSTVTLPSIYTLPVEELAFVETDLKTIFSKILTDVLERTTGIPEGKESVLWDNCLQSETNKGLVSMLAEAMVQKKELFMVYNDKLGTLREATSDEQTKIKDAYKTGKGSTEGVYVSFKNFTKSDLIRFYSIIEYCMVAGLYKTSNVARSLQFKMKNLRGSVGGTDREEVKKQVLSMSESLGRGKDIYLDAEDQITTAAPSIDPIKAGIELVQGKKCFYLGMPLSYVNGEITKGISDTGEGDSKAVERGLKNYYYSVIKPVVEAMYGVKTSFNTHDFRMVEAANEVLKTFELVGEEYISSENKLLIVNKLFGVETKVDKKVEGETEVVGSSNEPPPALNGAQVTSLVEVATMVQSKQIGIDAAKAIIALAFPTVTEEQLAQIVKISAGITAPPPAPRGF